MIKRRAAGAADPGRPRRQRCTDCTKGGGAFHSASLFPFILQSRFKVTAHSPRPDAETFQQPAQGLFYKPTTRQHEGLHTSRQTRNNSEHGQIKNEIFHIFPLSKTINRYSLNGMAFSESENKRALTPAVFAPVSSMPK